MRSADTVAIRLTARERHLILKYGYPFEKIARALKALKDSRGEADVEVDGFELEMLLGDLAYSTNRSSGALHDELYELSEMLEFEFRRRSAI